MAIDTDPPNFSYRSVQSADTAQSVSDLYDTEQPTYSWRHRLSLLTTTSLVFSCIIVPAVIAMLCFLWSDPPLDDFRHAWRDLVLGGWTVETITITTALLRTAVTGTAA